MHIRVCNILRDRLGDMTIDEHHRPDVAELDCRGEHQRIPLRWTKPVLDDAGILRGCPVCGCREIFKRRDFPQKIGMAIVIISAVISVMLFAVNMVLAAMAVLLGAVVVDQIIFLRTGQCLVCYRCRSEFRDTVIDEHHEDFELAIGEKYRPVRQSQINHAAPTQHHT